MNEPAGRVRIPVRIDFCGGWTDVHYFSAREGGAVLNGAIDRYVEGTVSRRDGEMRVEYRTLVPRGSGLGSSGALDVAWLALTDTQLGRQRSAVDLAEAAYRLEKLVGIEGGKQDQYAAAHGGFNHLRFGAEDDPAQVERLAPPGEVLIALEEAVVLCYTGDARFSGSLHERVWAPFLDGDRGIAAALREMRDTVDPAREALLAGDLETLGRLVTVNREQSRRLATELVTADMDTLFELGAKAGAFGSKACGAGGGGCLIFVCRPGDRTAVEAALAAAGAQLLPFAFEAISYWGDRAPA